MRLPRCRLLSLAPPRAGGAQPPRRTRAALGLRARARPDGAAPGPRRGPLGAVGSRSRAGGRQRAPAVGSQGFPSREKSRYALPKHRRSRRGGGLGSCALGCCTLGSCAQPPAEAPGGGGNRRGQRKIVAHKRNNQPAPQLLEFARRRIWGRPGRAPLACPKTQSCAQPRGCGVWRGMCDSPGGLGLVVGCT